MTTSYRNKTGFFSALLLSAFLAATCSCGRSAPRESEPNNDLASANELNEGIAVEGFLDTPDDVDMYKITLSDPSLLDIQLSAVRGINHSIKIWNGSTRELIKHIDDARKSAPERMCNLLFEGGVLYISVQHGDKDPPVANRENSYRLKVLRRPPGRGDEREPNDTQEKAAVVFPNSDVSGYFSPASNRLNISEKFSLREEDWFSLELRLEAGKPLLLDIDLSPVPDIDSVINVYGPRMEEILSMDSQGTGAGESLKGIGITESGIYRIMIAARNAAANSDIPYILSVVTREYDLSGEMEPNNDIRTANTIQTGSITGKIFPREDKDYFMVKSDGYDRLYKIEAVPAGNLDLAINIYNSSGKRVNEVNTGAAGEAELLPDVFFKEDIHIEVYSRSAAAEGDHYRLEVSSKLYVPGFEIEPNDSRKNATPIKGDMISGYTTMRGDVDYFLLEYPGRKRIRFEISAPGYCRFKVSITDPLGYVVRSVEVEGAAERKFHEMIDQRGYVIVKSLKENYREFYEIKLVEEP